MKKYLAIIPARSGSKGIPHKNILPIAGKPLIAYTFESAISSKLLDKIILTTDDEKIIELAKQHNIYCPFIRPSNLAGDDVCLEDVMLHALSYLKEKVNYLPDAVVLLQPTSPLRTSKHIDEAIKLFEDEDVDTVVSVSEPMEHPCDMVYFEDGKMKFLFDGEGFLAGKQRQDYPKFYFLNGAIYIFKTEVLLMNKSRFGKKVKPYLMRQIESIDIDSRDDFEIAELIITERGFLNK